MKLPAHAQTLSGVLERDGSTVIGIDSDSPNPLDWSGMFASAHAHLILNLDGYGVVLGEDIRLSLFPGMAAICRLPADGKIYASRLPKRLSVVFRRGSPFEARLPRSFGR